MVSIFDYLKNAFSSEMRRDRAGPKRRRQFNTEIEPDIANAVRNLAKMFKVPNYSACEHLLQVGIFYTLQAIRDKGKAELIGQHIQDRHLLDLTDEGEESIILLSQDNSNWLLLKQAKWVVRCLERFKYAMLVTNKTGDFKIAEKAKRKLDEAVFGFAMRLADLQLNRPKENGIYDSQPEKEEGEDEEED